MQITTISCGRTYNTTNYTSQRFDITANLEPGESVEVALLNLADDLHHAALDAMREQGVKYIVEPGGTLTLTPATPGAGAESDDQDIPF